MPLPNEEVDQRIPCGFEDFREQREVYEGLYHTLKTGNYVHAYLFSGPAGVGKRTLAGLTARYLLCTGEHKPCGVCEACCQVLTGNHPDVITLRPGEPIGNTERGRKTIPVDDIRALSEQLSRTTYEGGSRVVIIEQADKMYYPNASNALLKVLEEPPAGTVFMLLTDSPGKLLTTIISRCRTVHLHPWPDDKIRKILDARLISPERAAAACRSADGSIGLALQLASDEEYWQRRDEVLQLFFGLKERSDVLKVSNALKDRKANAEEMLLIVENTLRQMLLCRLGRDSENTIASLPEPWRRMAQKAELQHFTSLFDAVDETRKMVLSNVTWQAAAERFLLRLAEESNQWLM